MNWLGMKEFPVRRVLRLHMLATRIMKKHMIILDKDEGRPVVSHSVLLIDRDLNQEITLQQPHPQVQPRHCWYHRSYRLRLIYQS